MLPSVLALGAVAAVVLLLIGVFGRAPDGVTVGESPPVSTPTPTSPAPTGAATVSPPSTAAPPSTTEAPAPTAPATSGPVPPSTGAAEQPPPTTSPAELPEVDVVVLNSTGETGLAARVSDYLAGLGWPTGEPGNFAAAAEVTTVYFPDGYEEMAREVAAVVPGSGTSVAPVIPEVGTDVLTVVLGADATGWSPPTAATPT